MSREGDIYVAFHEMGYMFEVTFLQERYFYRKDGGRPESKYYVWYILRGGTRWYNWVKHCATSRKVAGSIPDVVIGNFRVTYSLGPYCGPGVDSASNRNEC